MEKKKRSFQMPHTYIIIFGVILVAAILTLFIPLGQYDTKAITYTVNGEEKTRTVVDPDSFRYVLDENGDKVTQAAPLFGTESVGGRGGILNYVFEGLTTGDKSSGAVGIIAFILVVGGAFGVVLRTGAIESGIMRVDRSDEWKRNSSDSDSDYPVFTGRSSFWNGRRGNSLCNDSGSHVYCYGI